MPSVSFIVCSAGLGHRMKPVSQTIPKHLLFVENKRLLGWSIDSLPFRANDQLILITQNHPEHNRLSEAMLADCAQKFKISTQSIYIDYVTRGQAATALLCEKVVAHSRIAIFNSDTYFQCHRLDSAIHDLDHFGIAPCFKTTGDEWSFFKTGIDEPFFSALQVEEKIKISDWCSTGFYYFREGKLFFESVKKSLSEKMHAQELYIAPIYKQFFHHGVKVLNCEAFKPMGTPSQLERFWGISIEELARTNATI